MKKLSTVLITIVLGVGVIGSAFAVKNNCHKAYQICLNGGGEGGDCGMVYQTCLDQEG